MATQTLPLISKAPQFRVNPDRVYPQIENATPNAHARWIGH